MHKEILFEKQATIFPKLAVFSPEFGLVGGTAIALQLGHRRSLDFDLVTPNDLKVELIRKKLLRIGEIEKVLVKNSEEYTLVVGGTKFTFFHYPFPLEFNNDLDGVIFSPDLVTLAAMKAYALGRRSKWKDYVDLYFISRELGGLDLIIEKAEQIFGADFNEKNFRAQLAYFSDIDFSEKVIYQKGFEVGDEVIKEELTRLSLG